MTFRRVTFRRVAVRPLHQERPDTVNALILDWLRQHHDEPWPLLKRAETQHLRLLLTLVEAFCALDQHPYEPARVESALRPLLEHDDFGVVYLVDDDQGYVGSPGDTASSPADERR